VHVDFFADLFMLVQLRRELPEAELRDVGGHCPTSCQAYESCCYAG
jgi:hypothetical protein